MAKNLYHSQLREMGPVHVQITTDVMESRFKGKPPYVGMVINGEDFSYSCETAACEEALQGLKGRKVMLEAVGGKEDADIKIVGAGQQPQGDDPESEHERGEATPPARQRRQAKPRSNQPAQDGRGRQERTQAAGRGQEAPPPQQRAGITPQEQAGRLHKARVEVNRLANCYLLCFKAATHIDQQLSEQIGIDPLPVVELRGIATTLFIHMTGRDSRMHENMPTGNIDLNPKAADKTEK